MSLFLLLKCYFPGTNFLCTIIFYIFLIFWCSYFCVIHRIIILLFKSVINHFSKLLYLNLWWIITLIVVYNPSLKNPGPKGASFVRQSPLNILHWNPNSILAHNGIRIRCLEALNTLNNYDLIAISESALHEVQPWWRYRTKWICPAP